MLQITCQKSRVSQKIFDLKLRLAEKEIFYRGLPSTFLTVSSAFFFCQEDISHHHQTPWQQQQVMNN
jgi:hypothetical protein